jgi:RNA polymerase sigma factor (sigma-70 family)
MRELALNNDDSALDWLFSRARKYPLLTAAQEQDIDRSKWQAIEQLLRLFVADDYCRKYLGLWARAILEDELSLEDFHQRDHYNLLKRELVDLLPGGDRHAALGRFAKCVTGPRRETRDCEAILALQLPASLVVGLAETLSAQFSARGVAAALQYWHSFWSKKPEMAVQGIDAQAQQPVQECLADYYAGREKLVNHNLRLVFSIAGRINGRGVPYRDLIQNGVLGLIRAAEKFQHQQGYRFSTYAYNWITQAMRQSIEDSHGIVRYPAGVNEKISRMHRERMQLLNATGHEPDVTALAGRLQMTPEALRRLQQVGNLSVSLDAKPDGDNEGLAPGETLAGDAFDPTQDDAEHASLNRCLMQRLGILEPSERRVVIRRWGLDAGPPLTRAEIASQLQVSAEWVRQLENSALAKLRNDEGIAQAYRDHHGA